MDVTQEIEQRAQQAAQAGADRCALYSISCVTSTLASVYVVAIFFINLSENGRYAYGGWLLSLGSTRAENYRFRFDVNKSSGSHCTLFVNRIYDMNDTAYI